MRNHRHFALVALTVAGVLWGTTVPMSKVALDWLGPGWLTVVRFTLATVPLAVLARRHLRAALTPAIVLWGAAGYGLVIVAQNAGIARTSVSHAALLVGSVPILVALISVALGHKVKPIAWAGFVVALGGVALVAGDGGAGATLKGDALVVASLVLSAAFVVAQPRLLAREASSALEDSPDWDAPRECRRGTSETLRAPERSGRDTSGHWRRRDSWCTPNQPANLQRQDSQPTSELFRRDSRC